MKSRRRAVVCDSDSDRDAPPKQRPLAGMRVSVTGGTVAARAALVGLIRELGAEFSPHLDPGVSALVVAPQASRHSEKFLAAIEWSVPLVRVLWLLECARRSCAVDTGPFAVVPTARGDSAPEMCPPPAVSAKATPEDSQHSGDYSTVPTLCGCKICIVGFAAPLERILRSHITAHRGILVHPSTLAELDADPSQRYVLVPLVCEGLQALEKRFVGRAQLVTDVWLENCIHEGKVFGASDSAYFTPFAPQTIPGLGNARVSLSGFEDCERYPLVQLLESFGATVTDDFVRGETKYLVSKEPAGRKFEKAVEWSVPAVSAEWIAQTAKLGCFVCPDAFLLRPLPILHGVSMYITPQTPHLRTARGIAQALGATVLHSYAKSCTHVLHIDAPGASPGLGRAARTARADGKHVVSPHWLQQCGKEGRRIPESDYPAHFDPQRKLALESKPDTRSDDKLICDDNESVNEPPPKRPCKEREKTLVAPPQLEDDCAAPLEFPNGSRQTCLVPPKINVKSSSAATSCSPSASPISLRSPRCATEPSLTQLGIAMQEVLSNLKNAPRRARSRRITPRPSEAENSSGDETRRRRIDRVTISYDD